MSATLEQAPIEKAKRGIKPLVLATVVTFIVFEIVFLSPVTLERDESVGLTKYTDPEDILESQFPPLPTLADGIPKNKIPDYSIERFHFISSKAGTKEWKIVAERAHLYSKEDLIHGRAVRATLYDAEGKETIITGNEAKFLQNKEDLHIYGDVQTELPDGFVIHSDYMRYQPQIRTVDIPDHYYVWGVGEVNPNGDEFRFNSLGLRYNMIDNFIRLPKDVDMVLTSMGKNPKTGEAEARYTTIKSDSCDIDRVERLAKFKMNAEKRMDQRFVRMTQPNLFVRSRTVDLRYGGERGFLDKLTAHDDVFIHETKNETENLRYATCGQADLDNDSNTIILQEYPQVYQDTDTVTGEVIIIYRDSDIVEVRHSNAFSDAPKNL